MRDEALLVATSRPGACVCAGLEAESSSSWGTSAGGLRACEVEAVGEGAGEPVGRKVEPPLVVHHSLWAEMENMEVSSLAVRRSRVVEGMTENVGGVVMYAQRAGIHRIQRSPGKSETQHNPGRRPSHNTNLLPYMAALTHTITPASSRTIHMPLAPRRVARRLAFHTRTQRRSRRFRYIAPERHVD